MKLFLISQDIVSGYDTYDSAVVAAESKEDAITIHPGDFVTHIKDSKWMGTYSGGPKKGEEYIRSGDDWVCASDLNSINVEYLGDTDCPRGVICASFNAG